MMITENTRLNIERAREALSKARLEGAAAVRSPRPADLSRLRENEARRDKIEAHASGFRNDVRARLGLGEYQGPRTSARSPLASTSMEGALCDADICTPAIPQMHEAVPAEAGQAPAVATKAHEGATALPPRPDETAEGQAEAPAPNAMQSPETGDETRDKTRLTDRSSDGKPKKRRKLFGLF